MRVIKRCLQSLFGVAGTTIIMSGLIVLGTASPAFAVDAGTVGSWTTSSNTLPSNRNSASSAAYNGYVYMVGGWDGSRNNTVYYAPLNSDGTVGTWVTSGNTLPQSLSSSSTAVYNGYIYVIGGISNSVDRLDTVYYAQLDNDGSVGTWSTSSNTLPIGLTSPTAVAHDGYVYVIGGFNISNKSTVYYAELDNDGSVGTWSTNANALPAANASAGAVVHNDYIYLVGGEDSGYASTDTVYHAKINSNGTIGTWTNSSNKLPSKRNGSVVAVSGSYLYVAGGFQNTSPRSDIFYAQLGTDGTVGSWSTSGDSLPQAVGRAGGGAYGGNLYVIGGDNSGSKNTVYHAELTPTNSISFTNPVNDDPVSLVTPLGTDTSCSNTKIEADLDDQDTMEYPLGLVGFCFRTDSTSNEVTITFVTDLKPSQVALRHYNPNTGVYTTVSGASITEVTYNSQPALRATYTVADNGLFDTNASDGWIDDPVGLVMLPVTEGAPNTGFEQESMTIFYFSIAVGAAIIWNEVRRLKSRVR